MNFICPTLPGILVNSNIPEINGSLWTLKIEIGFYIILPIIIYIIKRIRRKNIVLAIIYLLSFIWAIIASQLGISTAYTEQLPYYMRYFAIGMYFALNMNIIQNINNIHAVIALVFIIVDSNIKTVELIVMPIAIGILLFYVGFRFKSRNIMDLSYVMYLVHFPIIQIFNIMGIIEGYVLIAIVISLSMVVSLMWSAFYSIVNQYLKRLNFL